MVRRLSTLEQRLASSETRCVGLENAFAAYRDAARSTPEAEMQRLLLEARESARQAEAQAARALKAKGTYKAQVRRLRHLSGFSFVNHALAVPVTMLLVLHASVKANCVNNAQLS